MWNIETFRKELSDIVNMDSGTADLEGVGRVGRYLKEQFEEAGLFVTMYDGDTRLEARTHKGEDFDVMLVGHMDTVFPKGTAAQRPYKEKDGLAHGPGVADMKGGLIEVLHLVRRLKKEKPGLKICVAFDGDEETGSERGKDWLMELAGHTKYAFVFEPGRPVNCFVKNRKGCSDLKVIFHGKASHAGVAPEAGASVTVEMARWITALTSLQDLAAGTSVNAGMVRAGTASNVIPDYGEASFDFRFTDPAAYEKIKAVTRQLAESVSVPGVMVEYRFSSPFMPMNPSAVTEELMHRVDEAAVKMGIENGWVATGGVSDANHIAGLGIPTICGCGPCGSNLHSEEEYMELPSIEVRLNLMYSLLAGLGEDSR